MGFSNEGNLEENEPMEEMEKEEESGDKVDEFEHKDVENLFKTMGDMSKIQTLASKINKRSEKEEAAVAYVKAIVGDDESLQKKVARLLMNDKSEEEDASPELAQDAMSGNQNEEKDRFDEIFEDMYKEELSQKQSEVMDTDGDGDIDADDLANLRNK